MRAVGILGVLLLSGCVGNAADAPDRALVAQAAPADGGPTWNVTWTGTSEDITVSYDGIATVYDGYGREVPAIVMTTRMPDPDGGDAWWRFHFDAQDGRAIGGMVVETGARFFPFEHSSIPIAPAAPEPMLAVAIAAAGDALPAAWELYGTTYTLAAIELDDCGGAGRILTIEGGVLAAPRQIAACLDEGPVPLWTESLRGRFLRPAADLSLPPLPGPARAPIGDLFPWQPWFAPPGGLDAATPTVFGPPGPTGGHWTGALRGPFGALAVDPLFLLQNTMGPPTYVALAWTGGSLPPPLPPVVGGHPMLDPDASTTFILPEAPVAGRMHVVSTRYGDAEAPDEHAAYPAVGVARRSSGTWPAVSDLEPLVDMDALLGRFAAIADAVPDEAAFDYGRPGGSDQVFAWASFTKGCVGAREPGEGYFVMVDALRGRVVQWLPVFHESDCAALPSDGPSLRSYAHEALERQRGTTIEAPFTPLSRYP